MSKIFIKTDTSKTIRVVAETKDAAGAADHRQGNVDTIVDSEIIWEANATNENASMFSIRFTDLKTGNAVWPFKTLADGTTDPGNFVGPLELKPGASVALKTRGGAETVKYAVAAKPKTGGGDIESCDPMIIIRPPVRIKLTFAVICALLGAVLGAGLTWFFCR